MSRTIMPAFAEVLEPRDELPAVRPSSLYRNEVSDGADLYGMTLDELLVQATSQMNSNVLYEISGLRVYPIAVSPETLQAEIDGEPGPGTYDSSFLTRMVLSGVGRVLARESAPQIGLQLLSRLTALQAACERCEDRVLTQRSLSLSTFDELPQYVPQFAAAIGTAINVVEGFMEGGAPQFRKALADLIARAQATAPLPNLSETISPIGIELGKLLRAGLTNDALFELYLSTGVFHRIENRFPTEFPNPEVNREWDGLSQPIRSYAAIISAFLERRGSRYRDHKIDGIPMTLEQYTECSAWIDRQLDERALEELGRFNINGYKTAPSEYDKFAVLLGASAYYLGPSKQSPWTL